MIHVTVYKDRDNHYKGFQCDGHAGYAKHGEDIICSAVSVLVINTINAIKAFTDDVHALGIDEDNGIIDLSFETDPGHDASLLIDTMVLGLSSIETEYSEFIQLEIEEV